MTDRTPPFPASDSRRATKHKAKAAPKAAIGWREWAGLPDLGVAAIKAKVDTGARTSALHAYKIELFEREGIPYVRFQLHPVQRRRHPLVQCEAPVAGKRRVRNSGGEVENRFVIVTTMAIGGRAFPIELTLTNRDQMGFRMLIGRAAIRGHYQVDPGRSYIRGKPLTDATASGTSS